MKTMICLLEVVKARHLKKVQIKKAKISREQPFSKQKKTKSSNLQHIIQLENNSSL